MNIKKNNLVVKTFTYIFIFSTSIIIFLWLSQIVYFKYFYERYQYTNIKEIANTIIKSNSLEKIEQLAYDNNICIELKLNRDVYNYNTLNKDCILKYKNNEIIEIKNKLIENNKNKIIRVNNPINNSKNLLYGIKYSGNTYIILNTTLEDVSSVSYILRGQFIYITIIIIIISIFIAYYISKMINKPILEIMDNAKNITNDKYKNIDKNYDIKELNDLNNILNYARCEIKNTDELRKDLMANVGHDLKTPLTMIKAYAEMNRDITLDKDKQDNNLNIIIDEVDRLNILVNDILDLSKLENNNNLDIIKYDLTFEIKNIIKKYEIIKETEKYNFELNMPDSAYVMADKNRINQVLYNLINNAINYTGDNNLVKINVIDCESRYKVEIIDSGKGINKKDLPFIWNKYYKNEKNHKRNIIGTGLGLSIVKKILENHKFEYGVESKKNKGTKFYFYISK